MAWHNIMRSLNTEESALEHKVPEYWCHIIVFQVASPYIFLKWPALEKFKTLIGFK